MEKSGNKYFIMHKDGKEGGSFTPKEVDYYMEKGTYIIVENKKETMDKKIIGYKAPFDMFEGKIKAGTIYETYKTSPTDIKNSSGGFSRDERGIVTAQYIVTPLEVVETWEAVYEEPIKAGDFVVGWHRDGHIRKTEAWQVHEVRHGWVHPVKNRDHNTSISNLRKATPAEIAATQKVKVLGYDAEQQDSGVKIGCQSFGLAELVTYQTFLQKTGANYAISVNGENISLETINKLINLAQK